MLPAPLTDGIVRLRQWQPDDADWYVERSRDLEIQRWTKEPPDLTADAVRAAIEELARTHAHAGQVVKGETWDVVWYALDRPAAG